MITVSQMVEWIVANRRGNAFKDYSIEKILNQVATCAEQNSMLCVTNDTGQPCGVICCKEDKEKKTMYVYDILVTEPGVLKKMLRYFNTKYKGYTLEGKVRNRSRKFNNPTKLENLMLQIYGK